MKKLSYSLILLSVFLLMSHEFWLEADAYFIQPGQSTGFNFKVGENFTGEKWNLKRHRVEKLSLLTSNKTIDLKNNIDTTRQPVVVLPPLEEGTHLIQMQSNNAFIELAPDKFLDYLKEDGIENIIEYREKNKLAQTAGKEFYQRNTKLLVQAGSKLTDVYKTDTGMPMEIIPAENPFAKKPEEELTFTITFKKQPHSFALVKVWQKNNGKTFLQNLYTDKDGKLSIRIGATGVWMISTVKMEPIQNEKADYQSYWGSLVFAVK
ncbi:MAG: DUF4198 domain-containing protein [Chryseotalea sp.]|jgi:uncharacterized GH25 family protein